MLCRSPLILFLLHSPTLPLRKFLDFPKREKFNFIKKVIKIFPKPLLTVLTYHVDVDDKSHPLLST